MSLIKINPDKCVSCFQCARVCPVHAIRVTVGIEHPEIDDNRCIGCGTCIRACSYDAITYRSSTAYTKELLKSEQKVAAIVDPSISGEFPDITDYRKFVEMIRALGFEYVNEVSFGVDLVARAYQKLFDDFKGKYYLTSNCPAIVAFVEKFHPALVDNLAPIVSPMIATAMVVRRVFGQETKIVYIGPCIATKSEAELFKAKQKVDAVLTFTELRLLFDEFGIHESQLEFSEFDPPIGFKGSLYPVSNGFLQAAGINEKLLDGKIVTADGDPHSLDAVESFENYIDHIQKHFNLFYNKGCIMGPGMTHGGDKHLRDSLVVDYANKRLKNLDLNKWHEEMAKFSNLNLTRTFKKDDQRLELPDENKVQEILKLLGKDEISEQKSCSACGFKTCNHFATAIAQGISRTDMCYDFTLKNKTNYIATLRDTNKKISDELGGLKAELKTRKEELDLVNDKMETSRYILNQIPSGVIVVDEKLKVISSNRGFIELLGEEARMIDDIIPGLRGADLKTLVPVAFYKVFQNVLSTGENILSRDVKVEESFLNLSVFSIKKNKIVGGIVRDMFSPEVRNEQIIHRVTEVIDQNLGMVQKIGFLLGEGASKTEAMLNSIIQLHQKKKEG